LGGGAARKLSEHWAAAQIYCEMASVVAAVPCQTGGSTTAPYINASSLSPSQHHGMGPQAM